MDFKRLSLAAVVAWFVDTTYGLVVWILVLGDEMEQYPAVFRSQDAMNANVPLMFGGGLLAMFALSYLYARSYRTGNGVLDGLRFGLLLALFTFGFVSVSIYGSVNIDGGLAALGSVTSFIEMIVVGAVIGALYRPTVPHVVTAAA